MRATIRMRQTIDDGDNCFLMGSIRYHSSDEINKQYFIDTIDFDVFF